MDKKDLDHFEQLLLDKRSEIMKELGFYEEATLSTNLKEQTGDLSSFASHPADMGTDTMEREKNFQLASKEGRFLYHIEEALRRVQSGNFGSCRECGKEISRPRLEAVPHATLCIDCKTAEENKGKG